MKAFKNITLGELNDARREMRQMMLGIPAEFVDDLICWDAIGEYLHEHWGNEYDDDDRDLVYEELCMSHNGKYLYILEPQECEDGTEFLYIEAIMNGR